MLSFFSFREIIKSAKITIKKDTNEVFESVRKKDIEVRKVKKYLFD